jgi:hypothetical protein
VSEGDHTQKPMLLLAVLLLAGYVTRWASCRRRYVLENFHIIILAFFITELLELSVERKTVTKPQVPPRVPQTNRTYGGRRYGKKCRAVLKT